MRGSNNVWPALCCCITTSIKRCDFSKNLSTWQPVICLCLFLWLLIELPFFTCIYWLIYFYLWAVTSHFFSTFFSEGDFRRTRHTFRKRLLIFVIESFLECHLPFIYLWCLLTYGSFKFLGNHIWGSFPLWFLPLLLHVMILTPRTRLLDCKDCGHSILNKVSLVYLVSSWSYR